MSQPAVYENQEFISDLSRGRAIHSIVYVLGVARVRYFEWGEELAIEHHTNYPAEDLPAVRLKNKFRPVLPDGSRG